MVTILLKCVSILVTNRLCGCICSSKCAVQNLVSYVYCFCPRMHMAGDDTVVMCEYCAFMKVAIVFMEGLLF